jgi:hypothetical protein
MHSWLLFVALFGLVAVLRAESVEELVQIHLAVMGGTERIEALKAMRALGTVTSGASKVQFVMVAARPNLVRMETQAGGRTLMQGYDGVDVPWEFDTGTWPPKYRPIAPAAAKRLITDAEFDDPLVAGPSRGFVLELSNDAVVDGRKYRRILVTHKLVESFEVLLDPETYLIAFRTETRKSPTGRPVLILTQYGQFQAVKGVLLPHEIKTTVDGKLKQVLVIEQIEPNPATTAETFSRPKAITVPTK